HDAVRLKHRVSGIERRGSDWRVTTEEGGPNDADAVIIATETHAASRLLRYVDPALATMLEMIPYASSATVSLAYRRADIPHPLDGFGFVVPRSERRDLLASTFFPVKYPRRPPPGPLLPP